MRDIIINGKIYTNVSKLNFKNDLGEVVTFIEESDIPPYIDPILSNNSPKVIKFAFDHDMVPDTWSSVDGDIININCTDGKIRQLKLVDKQRARYEKVSGGTSNGVFMLCEVTEINGVNYDVPAITGKHSDLSSGNTGGWATSLANTVSMPEAFNLLPAEWQEIVSEVKIASTIGDGSTEISYSNNKMFCAAASEISIDVTNAIYAQEGHLFDYYYNGRTATSVPITDPGRIKNMLGPTSPDSIAIIQLLRTPYLNPVSEVYYFMNLQWSARLIWLSTNTIAGVKTYFAI